MPIPVDCGLEVLGLPAKRASRSDKPKKKISQTEQLKLREDKKVQVSGCTGRLVRICNDLLSQQTCDAMVPIQSACPISNSPFV